MIGATPFQGTHAVVTGGGRALGTVIARELARGGANLTLMGRDGDVLEVQASELKSALGATVSWVLCDVTDEKSITHACMRAEQQMGVVQILVNNSGQAEAAKFVNTSPELWRQMLDVNLTGAFLCIRCVTPGMIRAGLGKGQRRLSWLHRGGEDGPHHRVARRSERKDTG
jgi:3-hydroxybutyrate dehydrogenase